MTLPRLLILDDSQVHTIKNALERLKSTQPRRTSDVPRLMGNKGTQPGFPDIKLDDALERAAQLGYRDCLAITLRRNRYNRLGLLQHPQSFEVMATDSLSGIRFPAILRCLTPACFSKRDAQA